MKSFPKVDEARVVEYRDRMVDCLANAIDGVEDPPGVDLMLATLQAMALVMAAIYTGSLGLRVEQTGLLADAIMDAIGKKGGQLQEWNRVNKQGKYWDDMAARDRVGDK